MKLQKQRELIELRRKQFQLAKNTNNSSFQFPALTTKKTIDQNDPEIQRHSRIMSRQEQKKIRQQRIQARKRGYNTRDIKEIQI